VIQESIPGTEASPVVGKGSDECYTPLWLLECAAEILGGPIQTDPCWSPRSLVRPTLHGWQAHERGEDQPWVGRTWVNPPYSAPGPFMVRARAHDAPTIALVKLDPTTRWWFAAMRGGPSVCLLPVRVRFGGEFSGGGSAMFASALIAWRCSKCTPALGWWFTP